MQAVVCEFLPLCLERARSNPFVTVAALLQVLVELLRAVRSAAPGSQKIVTVDLGDLAALQHLRYFYHAQDAHHGTPSALRSSTGP